VEIVHFSEDLHTAVPSFPSVLYYEGAMACLYSDGDTTL